MNENNTPVETTDDFDAAYEELVGSDAGDSSQTTGEAEAAADEDTGAETDDATTEGTAPEAQDSDDATGTATEAEGSQSESEAEQEQPEDIDKLRQKLKSAEGRLGKFEESVEEMREKLNKLEQPEASEDKTEPTPDTPDDSEFVPPGMDKDDWLDLQEDYPDTAKALKEKFSEDNKVKAENRELKEKQAQEATDKEALEAFRKTILDVHPDYDTVIAPKLDDLQAFIQEQDSAVMKQQYQRIFDSGSAEEVNALVTDYKAKRGLNKNPTTPDPTPDKKLDNALAVPTKGGGNPNLNKGKVDMDDFDAAYEEALQSE